MNQWWIFLSIKFLRNNPAVKISFFHDGLNLSESRMWRLIGGLAFMRDKFLFDQRMVTQQWYVVYYSRGTGLTQTKANEVRL